MAIGTTKGAGVKAGAVPMVVSGSAHGAWVQANDDARTAQGATTNLYNPTAITDSTFHWVHVPQGTTGCLVRARVPIATTAVGTSPIVAIITATNFAGASNADPAPGGVPVTDGTIRIVRVDSPGIGDTGQTCTFPTSPSTTNCQCDSTWFYSAWGTSGAASLAGFDHRGGQWVGVLVMTAGACTASAAMPIDLLLLNG